MTLDVDKLLSEVDEGLASLATGNRTVALRMAEFLFELDLKLTEVLQTRVPAADYDKALARVTRLEGRCDSLEQDLRDAISSGEAWEKACHKIHRQVLDLVGVQSETNELVLTRLSDARSSLPSDAEIEGPPLPVGEDGEVEEEVDDDLDELDDDSTLAVDEELANPETEMEDLDRENRWDTTSDLNQS